MDKHLYLPLFKTFLDCYCNYTLITFSRYDTVALLTLHIEDRIHMPDLQCADHQLMNETSVMQLVIILV